MIYQIMYLSPLSLLFLTIAPPPSIHARQFNSAPARPPPACSSSCGSSCASNAPCNISWQLEKHDADHSLTMAASKFGMFPSTNLGGLCSSVSLLNSLAVPSSRSDAAQSRVLRPGTQPAQSIQVWARTLLVHLTPLEVGVWVLWLAAGGQPDDTCTVHQKGAHTVHSILGTGWKGLGPGGHVRYLLG